MSTPDYMPEPESPKDRAALRRLALQAKSLRRDPWKVLLNGSAAFDDPAQVLAFEAAHPNSEPDKELLIMTLFNVKATRYYQRLNHLITDVDALKTSLLIDAPLVHRLEDQKAAGLARRQARTLTPEG